MKGSKIARTITAIILSILLYFSCIAFFYFFTARSLVSPKVISRTIQSDEVIDAVTDSVMQKLGIERNGTFGSQKAEDIIDNLFKDKKTAVILDRYMLAINNTLATGESIEFKISKEEKTALIENAQRSMESMGIPQNTISKFRKELDGDIDNIINSIPQPDDIIKSLESISEYKAEIKSSQNNNTVMDALRKSVNTNNAVITIIIMIVLAVAIGLLIFHPYKWMNYIAIPMVIAGIFITIIGISGKPIIARLINVSENKLFSGLIDAFTGVIFTRTIILGIVFIAIAALIFVARYITPVIVTKINNKKVITKLADGPDFYGNDFTNKFQVSDNLSDIGKNNNDMND